MKVLVAPDKFKGSLTAAQVAECLAVGLERRPGMQAIRLPLADGGDGSVDAALAAGFRPYPVRVAGPLGQPHDATIAYDGRTAVVELANTCGITLLPGGRLDPLNASSAGFGQAVAAALALRPRTVVLALGGSASTDAGLGLLSALGATITDEAGAVVPPGGGELGRVARIDLSALRTPTDVRWIVAGDVDAVLHGPRGAARVFGPQKGATPAEVERLDQALVRLAARLGRPGLEAARTPGAGAAGGVGFAALLLGAEIRSGADFFLDLLRFDAQVAGATAVITGEGRIDDQTEQGKLPYVVAQRSAPRPCFAVVGSNRVTPGSRLERAFAGVHQLSELTGLDTRDDPELTARVLTQLGESISARL